MPDSLELYRAKRDFNVTREPAPKPGKAGGAMFVVQKHAARRAGLHWDFRLEHGGVLWSWAVPKGPSLDPADRRMAIHVEDHPIDYADFQGDIPEGQYGAGHVETWDRGIWEALDDPDAGMAKGHLHFVLHGRRLNGRFSLVRSRGGRSKAEAWFLIKADDACAGPGKDALTLEAATIAKPAARPGAVKQAALPSRIEPELCTLVATAPVDGDWLSEIKFDGYRIMAVLDRHATGNQVRLLTRNGLDWAERMPALAAAFARIPAETAVLDGELVMLTPDGASSFPALQAALKAGRDRDLTWFGFDLLHLDGQDWRPAPLRDRKAALRALAPWTGVLRYSDHVEGQAEAMHQKACGMGLEGIVCKRAASPYRAGRGRDWVKVKCLGREEFIVLGFTPPAGSRTGLGALQLGYFDPSGRLHHAGAVGTGFTRTVLSGLRKRLDALVAAAPNMLVSGDPIEPATAWVTPELVAEVEFTGWSGAGRLRHAVFLGLREDKGPRDVVREAADPEAERTAYAPRKRAPFKVAVPPAARPAAPKSSRIVVARAPRKSRAMIGHIEITHPDRALWPGITKQDLAEYWQAVAPHALPGLVARPLSILRCPDGIEGEKFFQKNGHGYLPGQIREGRVAKQPYLAIDDEDGLFAMAQMSAIELHAWGAPETDPMKPDTLVFDLDPGEGVPFAQVVDAAKDVRARLQALKLESFCRTSGGKGLHVVVPLAPDAGWDAVKPFCRAFAETMAAEAPDRYVAHVKIADRVGKILVDWLRNGLGATAIASFSPRARPGAGVAMPLAWTDVTARLDPGQFTVQTVPQILAKRTADPWAGQADLNQHLPVLAAPAAAPAKRTSANIVVARKPKPRA